MTTARTIGRSAAAVAAAVLLSLGASTPAMAASGSGAQVTNQNDCTDYGGGYIVCEDLHLVTNATTTPSGNSIYMDNLKYSYTATFGGQTYSQQGSDHLQTLIKNGQYQEYHDAFSETYAYTGGPTCTYTVHFHYANGQTQFERSDFSCV